MDPELDNPTNVIFIGGTGRCGTNLTKEILSEHPDVATLPFEYRFTIDPHGIIDCYNTLKYSWSPYIAHNKIQELEWLLLNMEAKNYYSIFPGKVIKEVNLGNTSLKSRPYADWELEKWFPHYHRHVDKMLNHLKELTYPATWPGGKASSTDSQMYFSSYETEITQVFRSFLRSLFNDLLSQTNKQVFVEDNTWNMLFAQELKTLLPEARFIHLIRDPRDVVASLIRQRWAPSSVSGAISYYNSLMDKIIEASGSLNKHDIFQLKLEDLVSMPDKMIRALCTFCDMEPFTGSIENKFTNSHSGRWILDFNEKEKKLLLKATKKYCLHYGY